jgi:hypothetical protein
MQPDDMYPNDSSYFLPREPAEQSISRKREKAHTLESLAVLKDILSHLEKRIAKSGLLFTNLSIQCPMMLKLTLLSL